MAASCKQPLYDYYLVVQDDVTNGIHIHSKWKTYQSANKNSRRLKALAGYVVTIHAMERGGKLIPFKTGHVCSSELTDAPMPIEVQQPRMEPRERVVTRFI